MSRVQDYRRAVGHLASAQKPGAGVPPYTRFVNRPMGRRLAAAAHVVGLSPDQVTAVSVLASSVGLALLTLLAPSVSLGLLIGFLMVLGYALDSADGQLARLRGGGGPSGEWLDHVSDQARHGAMHACVLIYLFRFLPDLPPLWLLVPMAYGVSSSTRFLSQILAEQLRRRTVSERPRASGAAPAGSSHAATHGDTGARLRACCHLPADPGVLCLTFALSGLPAWFFVAYTALCVLNTASTVVSLARKRTQLRALDPGPAADTGAPFTAGRRPDGRGTTGTSGRARRRDRPKQTNPSS